MCFFFLGYFNPKQNVKRRTKFLNLIMNNPLIPVLFINVNLGKNLGLYFLIFFALLILVSISNFHKKILHSSEKTVFISFGST